MFKKIFAKQEQIVGLSGFKKLDEEEMDSLIKLIYPNAPQPINLDDLFMNINPPKFSPEKVVLGTEYTGNMFAR